MRILFRANHRTAHCQIKRASSRRPKSLFCSDCMNFLVLFLLTGTCTISGQLINPELPKTGITRCNGTVTSVHQVQSEGISTSRGHMFSGSICFAVIPRSTAGLSPDEPCPSTELFDSYTTFQQMKNQV
jgi:hypothetical protein